jgi:hypothetical protein
MQNNQNTNKKLRLITKKSRQQKQRRNVELQRARLLSGKVAKQQSSEVVPNYGRQLGSIVSKGYGGTLRMFPSTLHFAQVYANPFLTIGARLPAFPVRNSQLFQTLVDGVMNTNAGGSGWIVVTPGWGVTNNQACCYFTNAPTSPPASAFVGAIGVGFANSPYTMGTYDPLVSMANTLNFRLVSVGVKVRYDGTELNRGGSILCGQCTPENLTLFNVDYSGFQKYPGVKEYPVSEMRWSAATRQITDENDLYWLQVNNSGVPGTQNISNSGYPGQISVDNSATLGIYIQSANPNTPFIFSLSFHWEAIGIPLQHKAITKSDAVGLNHIVDTYAAKRIQDKTTVDHAVPFTTEDTGPKVVKDLVAHDEKKLDLSSVLSMGAKMLPLAMGLL